MIVLIVYRFVVIAEKAERYSPIAADLHGPHTSTFAFQIRAKQAQAIHVRWAFGLIEVRQNQSQSYGMLRLNPRLAACVVKARQPFVSEGLNHRASLVFDIRKGQCSEVDL